MRIPLIWIAGAFVFGNFYFMVQQKETLLRDGQTVYLALTPVDPRSLLQGDYMALDYAITNQFDKRWQSDSTKTKLPTSVTMVIQLNGQNEGQFVRLHEGEAIAQDERLLKFHHKCWHTVIGPDSYFFPEGTGSSFEHAAFGELKIASDGTPLLLALCDKNHQRLIAKTCEHPITIVEKLG